jgi:hypothetical protein
MRADDEEPEFTTSGENGGGGKKIATFCQPHSQMADPPNSRSFGPARESRIKLAELHTHSINIDYFISTLTTILP